MKRRWACVLCVLWAAGACELRDSRNPSAHKSTTEAAPSPGPGPVEVAEARPKPAAPEPAVVPPVAVGRTEIHSTQLAPSNGARVFAGTSLKEDDILEQLANAPVLALRSVGNTSTVFKATLKSEIGAAYKVAIKKRPRGPHSEIAAYRLARCLGITNVPPAISRRLPVAMIRADLDAEHAASWPSIEEALVVDPDRKVFGAAVYWIEGMQNLGLDTDEGQARVAKWLTLGTELPSEDRTLATQTSTLLAFDYLIGNWDRWSGGNLKGDAAGRLLYMRDHDASFAARLSEPLLRRMLDPLVRAQRFSRSFYLALQALSRDSFKRELAKDPSAVTTELLDAARIDGLFERRQALLSHIAASIEEHGEVNVLVFP